MKKILFVWKTIFSKWRYVGLALVVAILFYLLNVITTEYITISSIYSELNFIIATQLLFTIALNFGNMVEIHSFITLIIISIFLGMLVSIITYRTKLIKQTQQPEKKIGLLATVGIFLGILAPGCAACGIGLLSLLGLSTAVLSFLPFHGLEISILSILILGFAIYSISKGVLECKLE